MNWDLVEVSRNVHRLRHSFKAGVPFRTLWISDLHWDNPHCDRNKLKRHLDQALEINAPIIVVGDFFCAMQGAWDKRKSKDDIRPEHQNGIYLDSLVDTAIEWFEPYKHILAVIGYGNHETAILKCHETDLIDRFCGGLRQRGGIVQPGGYNGWIQHKFSYTTLRKMFNFYYAHGSGGGAAVTKGQINFNRWREQVTSDAFIAGHIHRRNSNDQVVVELNDHGRIIKSQLDYVRCSTYKDEFEDGAVGWWNERQNGPRPLGGYWCEWTYRAKEFHRRWIPTD